MPIQLTDEERNQLVQQGINPDDYEVYSPEEAQQNFAPLPSSSVPGTFVRAAANAAPGVVSAMAGAAGWRALAPKIGLGLAKGARLTSPAGVASIIAEPAVAMGAGYLGQKSVEGLFGQPTSWMYDGDKVERIRQARLQQEADMKAHKPTYVAGNLASQLPFGKLGFNRDLKDALGRVVGGSANTASDALSEAAKFALARAAVAPAAAAGVGLGLPALEGQSPDWAELIPSVAMAALQQKSWLGNEATPPRIKSQEKAFKYKAPEANKVKEIADDAPEKYQPQTEQQANPEAAINQQQDLIEAIKAIEESIKSGKPLYNVDSAVTQDPAAYYKEYFKNAPKPVAEPQQWDYTQPQANWPEDGNITHGAPRKYSTEASPKSSAWLNQKRKQEKKIVPPKNTVVEQLNSNEISSLRAAVEKQQNTIEELKNSLETRSSWAEQDAARQEEFRAKYQQPRPTLDYNSFENRQRQLDYQAAIDEIAVARKAKISAGSNRIYDATGQSKAAFVKPRNTVADIREIGVDTALEHQTTRPHELSHGQLEDMAKFGSAKDKAYAKRMLESWGGDEEALVQAAAENASKRDVVAGVGNIRSLGKSPRLENFKRLWRMRLGRGSKEDYAELLSDKVLNDPAFDEYFAGENTGATAGGGIKYQDPIDTIPYQDKEALARWLKSPEENPAPPPHTSPDPSGESWGDKLERIKEAYHDSMRQMESSKSRNKIAARYGSYEQMREHMLRRRLNDADVMTPKSYRDLQSTLKAREVQREKSNAFAKAPKLADYTPEQQAKVDKLEQSYKEALHKLGFEEVQKYADDGKSLGVRLQEIDPAIQRSGETLEYTAQKIRDLQATIRAKVRDKASQDEIRALQRRFELLQEAQGIHLRKLRIARDRAFQDINDNSGIRVETNEPPQVYTPKESVVRSKESFSEYKPDLSKIQNEPELETSWAKDPVISFEKKLFPETLGDRIKKSPPRNLFATEDLTPPKNYVASPEFEAKDIKAGDDAEFLRIQHNREKLNRMARENERRAPDIDPEGQGYGNAMATHQRAQAKAGRLQQGSGESNEDWIRRLFTTKTIEAADESISKYNKISTKDIADATGLSNSTLKNYFSNNLWQQGSPLPDFVIKHFDNIGKAINTRGDSIINNLTDEQVKFISKTANSTAKYLREDFPNAPVKADEDAVFDYIKDRIRREGLQDKYTFEDNVRRLASDYKAKERMKLGEGRNREESTEGETAEGETFNKLDTTEHTTQPKEEPLSLRPGSAKPEDWFERFDQSIKNHEPLIRVAKLKRWMIEQAASNPDKEVSLEKIAEYIGSIKNKALRNAYQLDKFGEDIATKLEEYRKTSNEERAIESFLEKENTPKLSTEEEAIKKLLDPNRTFDSGVKHQDPVEDRSSWDPAEISFSNKSDRYKNTSDYSPTQEHPLTLGPAERLLGSFTNTLRREYGRSGEVLANAIDHFHHLARKYSNSHYNHFQEALQSLKPKEREQLYKVFIAEDRSESSHRDVLPDKLLPVYDAIREEYRLMGQEAIDAGQPVMTPAGGTRERQIKEFSFPNMTRPDVIDTIIERPESSAAKALKEDFIQHQIKMLGARQNMSEKQAAKTAEERFNNYRDALRNVNTVNDSAVFSGNRLVEGVGLPDSWIEPDISQALKRYSTRFGYDRAHFDAIEKNPSAMKVLGRDKDYYNREVQHTEESKALETIGGEDIKFAEQVLQGKMNQSSPGVDAISNVVNTMLTPGFTTGVWDVVTTVGKQLGQTSPLNIPKLIGSYLKATADTAKYLAFGKAQGYTKNALDTGYAKINRTIFEGLSESQTRMSDRLNKISNSIRYWNGRQASEILSHSLSQAGGEVQGLVMQTAALGGDKNAQSFMKKLFPEGWENASLEEIGSRIGQLTQGRYDVTELPKWVFDSNLAPFVKLQRWNIGQGNNFVRYLLDPIKQDPGSLENWSRLFTAVLGAGLAGGVIEKLKEELNNRKSQLPTWDELDIAKENKYRAALYKLAVTADMAGTFGSFGSLAAMASSKLVGRAAFGGFGFPMVDTAGKFSEETTNMLGAVLEDPSMENLATVLPEYVKNVTGSMIGGSAAISGAYSRINPESRTALNKQIGDEFRDMTTYEMTQEGNVNYGKTPFATDYSKTAIRNFKRDRTINQDDIDAAAENIANTSKDPLDMMEKLESASVIPDRSMPSLNDPMKFLQYFRYIRDTQGEEKARDLVRGYVQRQGLNEMKKVLLTQTLFKKLSLR